MTLKASDVGGCPNSGTFDPTIQWLWIVSVSAQPLSGLNAA
jgi:hypothetical protein